METSETDNILKQIPSLRRYARALTGNQDQADDLVQDCLERGWRRLHLWRPGSDLRAWLFTIMHNLYVNQVRRYRATPHFVPVDAAEDCPDTSKTADDAMVTRQLEEAIAELPEKHREVLLLVALEAMRYEQVAEILDIPIGTVMSRLSRARQSLLELLDGAQSPASNRLRRVK